MSPEPPAVDGVLVIGDLEASRLGCSLLRGRGHRVVHLCAPTDREIADALATGVDAVLVIVHSDVQALRYVLVAEHLRPGIRHVTSVFDHTVADQVRRAVPDCTVTSPADVAAPAIVAACVSRSAVAITGGAGDRRVLRPGVDADGPGLVSTPWRDDRRPWQVAARWLPRWVHGSTGLMLGGLLGLAAILLADWALAVAVLHEEPLRALYVATRIVAGVGPADANGHEVPGWYLVASVLFMLAAIVLTGTFIAGVVEWLQSTRTVGLVGRRTLPRRDHVVVAGLGQVGYRTCLLLRELGLPVVALERNPAAPNVRRARAAKVPVLIGHAEDRAVMEQVALPRARSLAALGSDDLDNVEIAISALAVAPEARIVLRAGEDDVVAETRSLFHIGQVVDVSAMTALTGALAVDGVRAEVAFMRDGEVHVLTDAGDVHGHRPERCGCHLGEGERR